MPQLSSLERQYVLELIASLRIKHPLTPNSTYDEALEFFRGLFQVQRDIAVRVSKRVEPGATSSPEIHITTNTTATLAKGSKTIAASFVQAALTKPLARKRLTITGAVTANVN